MKNSKKSKKLFLVMIHYILIFSLFFFILFAVVGNGVLNYILDKAWNNTEKVSKYHTTLESGKFDKLPKEKIFGKSGFFDILDENNNTIFSSNEKHTYSTDELLVIWDEESTFYVTSDLINNEKMIMKYDYTNTGGDVYYVLDKDNNVKETNDISPVKSFSESQLKLIKSYAGQDNIYIKHAFTYNNKPYTLVGYEVKYAEGLENFVQVRNIMFFVFFLMFAGGIFWLVNILNGRVNKPLDKFNNAITQYTNNRIKTDLDVFGIKEFEDITHNFENMIESLEQSEKANIQLQKDRQVMLASISHDLKTPITIVQGYSKAIVDKVIVGDEILLKSQVIYDKSCYINELVNNFSTFSLLEHPDFAYNFIDVDITETVRNFLARKYDELESKNINLVLHIPENKIMVKLDVQQFNRVLENIVNNAIKYGSENMSLKIVVDENKVMISNSGKCIDDKFAKDVFKPFAMGDESRSKGGSGLGLSIVKKIVEDHGFTISLITDKKDTYKTNFIIKLKNS